MDKNLHVIFEGKEIMAVEPPKGYEFTGEPMRPAVAGETWAHLGSNVPNFGSVGVPVFILRKARTAQERRAERLKAILSNAAGQPGEWLSFIDAIERIFAEETNG